MKVASQADKLLRVPRYKSNFVSSDKGHLDTVSFFIYNGGMTKKYMPSQEMLDDYSKMGDKELSKKYGVSRRLIIELRKEYKLQSFNLQHALRPHEFIDGKEYKWCGAGHWDLVENFGVHSSRYDGLRGHCKLHSNQSRVESYNRTNGALVMRNWLQTEKGRESRSATMRRHWLKRRGQYIRFEIEDEQRIYELCNKACAYCKIPLRLDELEFDHFIPIKLGGYTVPNNMLPACRKCNRGKRDKEPHYWLTHKFGIVLGEQIYSECVKVLSTLENK
jgi:5-methylcytosine-specific restriction endonuclease McrA